MRVRHVSIIVRGLLLVFLAGTSTGGWAQNLSWESSGFRFGANPGGPVHHFRQAEGFANWNLPWDWNLEPRWRLQSRLDFSLGWLGGQGGDAVVGSLGPSLVFKREGLPVSFEGGVSPTLLSRQAFANRDFGVPLQFTSHIGFNVDVWSHFRMGYRFQHMSNAGLSTHNPGLNLHMLQVSYWF